MTGSTEPTEPTTGVPSDLPPAGPHWRRRALRATAAVVLLAFVVFAPPKIWLTVSSSGHLYTVDDAPAVPVVIVFGAELAPGGTEPKPFLRGRLEVAAQLVTMVKNSIREFPAGWKAAYDLVSHRPPAVSSPPDAAVTRALED